MSDRSLKGAIMRKTIFILVVILILSMLSVPVFATEEDQIQVLSAMSEEECIDFVLSHGCTIPVELIDYDELGSFIKYVITVVEQNPDYQFTMSYYVTRDFAEAIKDIVNEYYGRNAYVGYSTRATVNLVDSISLVDEWSESFEEYNCYSYALGVTGEMDYYAEYYYPGYISNRPFSISYSVYDMALSTVEDLKVGNDCVIYSNAYSDIMPLSSTHNIICLRKCTQSGVQDFHFMKYTGRWYHKPGTSAPLRYKHEPYSKSWTDEGFYENGIQPAYRYYTGTIYYFAFGDHSYTQSYGGENYHSGNQHYYKVLNTCVACGDTYYTWDVLECNGPPCIDYSPYAHDDFELVEE